MKQACEDATGCLGSGDYAEWAEQQGYPHCEVLDWTSSAGDWDFVVSMDGESWQIMTQRNNYPRMGFTRHILDGPIFEGDKEEATGAAWAYFLL